jgi:hypothetical protein
MVSGEDQQRGRPGSKGQAKGSTKNPGTPSPFERLDLRAELERLDSMISELKVLYEQYFSGLMPLAPEKPHAEVKAKIRQIRKAPFKSSALNYRLKALEVRYSTLNTYWQRILKQREEGTYSKDIFKANLRERLAVEEAFSNTAEGAAEKGMRNLFDAYRTALNKQGSTHAEIDFGAFRESLLKRARDFKEKHKDKKLTFKVVVKDGKVMVKATAKDSAAKGAGA